MAMFQYIDLAMHVVNKHLATGRNGSTDKDAPIVLRTEGLRGHAEVKLLPITVARPRLHEEGFDYFDHFELVSHETPTWVPFRLVHKCNSELEEFTVAEVAGILLQHSEANDYLTVESKGGNGFYRWGSEDANEDTDAFPENEVRARPARFLVAIKEKSKGAEAAATK